MDQNLIDMNLLYVNNIKKTPNYAQIMHKLCKSYLFF